MNFVKSFACKCGKFHDAGVDKVIVENGAVKSLSSVLKEYNCKKPFLVFDKNTEKVAYGTIQPVLSTAGYDFTKFVFQDDKIEPNEYFVGSAIMNFDNSCDIVIGVGSGVINDVCKILSNVTNLPYVIVATAPSMDGYASKTSSMAKDGLKVSLPSKCANVIIGDIDILKTAPLKMMLSGLGDMLAKYVSITEWRISNVINGEYYCESVADLIRQAVKNCIDNAEGLLKKEDNAVKAVFEGLILGGVCMNYAGCSRPASGVEHYFSHVWDMRSLEFNTASDFHGIQCAIATLYAVRIYEKLFDVKIDREKALSHAKNFDYKKYSIFLKEFLGKSAISMIELEKKEGKYNVDKHRERLEKIIKNFQTVKNIIKEEIIPSDKLEGLLLSLNMPTKCSDIGIDESSLKQTFNATKDIRDKYVLSRFLWDLGIIDEMCIE